MNIEPLARKVAGVGRRVRTQRGLDGAALFGAVGAAIGAVLLLLHKLNQPVPQHWSLIAVTAAPALGALYGITRTLPSLWAAQLIDRSHNLADRFASALTFAQQPAGNASAFEVACVRDALRFAPTVEPAVAAPFHRPPALLPWLVSLSAMTAIGFIEPQASAAVVATPPSLAPALLHEDDLNAFRKEAVSLQAQVESRELDDTVKQLNALLEKLAQREVDREQALRSLRAMEEALQQASPAHPEALKDALGTLGKALERAHLTKPIAKALSETDPSVAAEETRRTAAQLRDSSISPRELEAMRAALKRAADSRKGQTPQDIAQRRQELERLLQRERDKRTEPENSSERRLLNRRQRELERLQREEQAATEQQRQLERLERELDQAAENLSQGDRDEAAEAMERGAEELNRMAREQMTEQQRQQLRQQLEQLREMLRRQQQAGGQGGGQGQQRGQGGQRLKLDQFTKLAQGQQGQGQQGQGQQGQGQQPQQGQGQQGEGQQPGGDTRMLTLGGDGQGEQVTLEVPGVRRGTKQGTGANGSGAGTEPQAPNTQGAPTQMDAEHVNTRVEGEQQAGPSRSQVIEGASHDGFAARGYEKVFTDYQRHAESVIERDEIPGGYRFYVRRYFQLIRPREAGTPDP